MLEPLRFVAPLNLLMAVPAGSGVVRLTGRVVRLGGGGRRGMGLAALAWLALLGAGWAVLPGTVKKLVGRRPLAVGIAPEMTTIVEWLRTNTDGSPRILFEDQLQHPRARTDPESTHWTPLLPLLLGRDSRQFIGGLYHMAFIRHNRMASFGDFRLGDQPIDQWSPRPLRAYCDLYNVGWVVCWSPLSRFWFDRMAAATRVATFPRYGTPGLPTAGEPYQAEVMGRLSGRGVALGYLGEGDTHYAVYRLDRPRSFALRGQARVVAVDFNRIELADVVPHEGSVLLSLHWIDGWRTDPPARIGPEHVPLDPADFVRIDLPGPVPRLVIFNGYGRR